MRTTLELPDELLTEVKILSAQERVTLKELIADLLRAGIKARQVPFKPAVLGAPYRTRFSLQREGMEKLRQGGRG